MSLHEQFASSRPGNDEKKATPVPTPAVHAGVAAALCKSYALQPMPDDFANLLARIR